MNKRFRLGFLIPLIGMIFLLFQSGACRAGVRNGLRLCGRVLIPSLFPFIVLSNLTISTGLPAYAQKRFGKAANRLFSLPGSAAAPLAIGLLGGYPLGVYCLSRLYQNGSMQREDALRLSSFCNNPGPAFLVGAIGAVCLESSLCGFLLLGITFLSAILTGILFSAGTPGDSVTAQDEAASGSFVSAFPAAVSESVKTMLRVSGMVVFFSAFQPILMRLLWRLGLPDWLGCIAIGGTELTSGIPLLQTLPLPLRFLLCAFLTNWGGLCVHLQSADALMGAGLPVGPYFAGKAVQSLISLLLAGVALVLMFRCGMQLRIVCLSAAAVFLFFLFFFAFFQKGHWKKPKTVI